MEKRKLFIISFVIGLAVFTVCAAVLYINFGEYFHILEELVGI